jgi:hypothetical protein
MKSTIQTIGFTIAIFIASFFTAHLIINHQKGEEHEFEHGEVDGMDEDIAGRVEWMNNMLADPATGKIPNQFRDKELAYAATLPIDRNFYKTFGNYTQRGPWNVGGRTRAIAIDKTNENILLAGSTMGGFWRSINGGTTWNKCIDSAETANISCIAQDTRTGKTNTWYAGTGELYGSSLPGAFFSGNGVCKSTDGGLTWKRLSSTSSTPGGIYNSWSAVHSIVINPTIDSLDVVFVATFNGIYRSVNGGTSFQSRRGGGTSGYSYWTDVAITSSGIVYAALSSGGSNAGIWRSTDNGGTWANITPTYFNSTTDRIVIGISPSDEKQVYFAAYSPNSGMQSFNFEGTGEWNSLWKYTYINGNGTATGGQWEDRSANIPKLGGEFGDFISQQGYCLSVKVKPDDPNTVFLGGTNLYRSTDGFSTKNNITWVGGYGVNTKRPDFKVYPNHHPDNHGVIFYPSNPSKMISVNDGGISRTDNCSASTVSWNSLNSGYLTTQFYTVAIDHASTNDVVIGGLQDNGTYYTNNEDVTSAWKQPLSSDGSFCFLAPNATEAYLSIQQGRMQRILLDANGNPTQFARIDPKDVDKKKYQFINPFTPDANNWKMLYTPAGDRIWRNDDVSAIPLHNQLDSNAVLTNWNELLNTKLADSLDEITAIVSSKNQPDVIYYGTQKGKLYRLRNASSNTSIPENIRGTNFPNVYINCIVQHPTDTNKLYAVFTNYGVLSIFYSSNGGSSWSAVSGNLEQNVDGSGNGPSCRWLTIAMVNDSAIYFAGTSTGLYATKNLNGTQTIWTKQAPNEIGNSVVMMMDYRTIDGRFAVATYGAGIFTAKLQSIHDAVNEKMSVRQRINMYPNPVKDELKIELPNSVFNVEYNLMSVDGKIVLHGKLVHQISTLNLQELKAGIYFLNINVNGKWQGKKLLKE